MARERAPQAHTQSHVHAARACDDRAATSSSSSNTCQSPETRTSTTDHGSTRRGSKYYYLVGRSGVRTAAGLIQASYLKFGSSHPHRCAHLCVEASRGYSPDITAPPPMASQIAEAPAGSEDEPAAGPQEGERAGAPRTGSRRTWSSAEDELLQQVRATAPSLPERRPPPAARAAPRAGVAGARRARAPRRAKFSPRRRARLSAPTRVPAPDCCALRTAPVGADRAAHGQPEGLAMPRAVA